MHQGRIWKVRVLFRVMVLAVIGGMVLLAVLFMQIVSLVSRMAALSHPVIRKEPGVSSTLSPMWIQLWPRLRMS
jgi:hypothetical protein